MVLRGINSVGAFCYVELGTVRFHLKLLKLKPDFQLKEDGTLTKRYFKTLLKRYFTKRYFCKRYSLKHLANFHVLSIAYFDLCLIQ